MPAKVIVVKKETECVCVCVEKHNLGSKDAVIHCCIVKIFISDEGFDLNFKKFTFQLHGDEGFSTRLSCQLLDYDT